MSLEFPRPVLLQAPGPAGKAVAMPGTWILRAALLSTLLGGSLLGAVLLLLIAGALAVVPEAWVQLHAHVQIFGFAALLVVGVSAFVVPRFWNAPSPRPAVLGGPAAAILGGVLCFAAGLLLLPAPAGRLLLVVSGALELSGCLVWAATLLALHRGRGRGEPGLDRYLLAGAGWLVLAASLQAWGALRVAGKGSLALPGVLTESLYAAALYGFIGSWIVGVGLRVVVGPSARRAGRVFWAWQAAVLLLVLAPWAAREADALRAIGRGLLALAGLAIAAEPGLIRRRFATVTMIGERRKERIQRSCWMSLALHSLLLGGCAVAVRPHALILDATRHVFTLGVLGSMALAMASRIFPRLGSPGRSRPRLLAWGHALLLAALGLRLLEIPAALGWPSALVLVAPSGFLALAGLLLGFGSLLGHLRPGAREEAA